MYTKILQPERETSLRGTTADVSYGRIRFGNSIQEFWLPQEVTVDLDYPDWNYVSRHKYSDYHLFSVESDYQIVSPKVDE
jgi:hypothetical protein